MTKKNIRANNPLTVIAIFSMLTEASAAVSLPFIDSENQSVYVWFLIAFPSFLIVFFFLTLNFNNQTLYSPSDFKNEEYFIKKNITATPPSLDSTTETHKPGETPKHAESAYSSGTKFPPHMASSFVFFPQATRHTSAASIASSDARKPANQNRSIARSFLLTAHTDSMNIYLIDLNAPNVGLPPKISLNDAVYYYCKKIRTQRKNTKGNCFILFLTNNQLNSVFSTYRNHATPHKKNHLPENMTVMHYNTDTAMLNTFLQASQV